MQFFDGLNFITIFCKGVYHYVHPKRNPHRYRIPAQLPGV